jgi:hypothetical protein
MNAKTEALYISTIHDGATYDARKHCAAKYREGYYSQEAYLKEIRAIVSAQASTERAQFKTTYKASDITSAARLVADYMTDHDAELLRDRYDSSKPILANIRRWFDSINGNSYFSVRVQVPTAAGYSVVYIPFKSGYGSHPEWETMRKLQALEILPTADDRHDYPGAFPIEFTDSGYGLKRYL